MSDYTDSEQGQYDLLADQHSNEEAERMNEHNYRVLTPVGWFTCDTQERLEEEIKRCTDEPRAEFYQPGIGWVKYNPQPVDYAAIIKQCFDEIEAKRKFAIEQRQHGDDWEYEYYDGMVDAYARAMAILEEHMKKKVKHERN